MTTSSSSPTLERDAVKLDPQHYVVEAETDEVRVVRIKYDAGYKSVMHQHPRGVGVFITDGHFRFTYPDGRTEEIRAKAGDFLNFSGPWEHLPENLEDKPFEAVYVELKR